MQPLWDLITNAHMEAWIWGPLMGAVVGIIFAGFNAPLSEAAPVTVIQTTRVFVTTNITIHNKHNNRASDDNGTGAFILFLFIATLFLVWKYVVYVEYVRYAITVLITTVFSFSFSTATLSVVKGQFNSSSWLLYLSGPMTVLAANYFLLTLATTALDPELPVLAAKSTPFDFYIHKLSEYGRMLIVFQMLGMILILITTVCTAIILMHYLGLMNQRSAGSAQLFWTWLTRTTFFFSGKGWLVLMTALVILAYFFIEPSFMPTWTTAQRK